MNLWSIGEGKIEQQNIPFCGNKYLTGNGYFGVRGTMEEYTKEQMCAINLSGIYERVGDAWRESVNAPNPLYTYIIVNGKNMLCPTQNLKSIPKSSISETLYTAEKPYRKRKTEMLQYIVNDLQAWIAGILSA